MTEPIFLNCRVRKVDGSPVPGIHIRSLCLGQPHVVYCGYSDSAGEVQTWSHHDEMNQRKYLLRCTEGSDWRILFDIPNHPFRGISADLHITGSTHASANLTVTVAPQTLALSNGSFEEIARSNGVSSLDPSPGFLGPQHMGPRDSSSLGSISDISSFTLDSDAHLSDARSIVGLPCSPRSPVDLSEADDPTLDDWFEAEMGWGSQHPSTQKRKYEEGDVSDDGPLAKLARHLE